MNMKNFKEFNEAKNTLDLLQKSKIKNVGSGTYSIKTYVEKEDVYTLENIDDVQITYSSDQFHINFGGHTATFSKYDSTLTKFVEVLKKLKIV